MTAVMSPSSSPAPSPAISSPSANPAHAALPPLITSPPARRTTMPRPMSHASKNRLSQYSTTSTSRSRPVSYMIPIYPSSLPYTLVRDFAYPVGHPMHYGPPPESSRPASGLTTPASDSQRRLSDPQPSWESKMSWETGTWSSEGLGKGGDIPPIYLADGPPWSEDEDLQSPVVSSRQRRHKSSSSAYAHSRARPSQESTSQGGILNPNNFDRERGYFVGTGTDGSERYYVTQGEEPNGPGGEFVTYPAGQARHSMNSYQAPAQRAYHYGGTGAEPNYRSGSESSAASSPRFRPDDQSRYSRDYQFMITSPDEEMHGKAVALFDFARENENELPLVEGQIILVSYRHNQGWLVAMDPKTQESGLVPETYVRLVRDIEGGITSLTGGGEGSGSPNDAGTPTQAEHHNFGHTPTSSTSGPSNGYHQPVVSTFSTSSKDLERVPQHLLGSQAGQAPPQVVHYHGQRGGSQANTPTVGVHQETGLMRRGSQDTSAHRRADSKTLETLPSVVMETDDREDSDDEDDGKNKMDVDK